MFIPSNMTEDEVVSVINRIAGIVAPQFVFGYHSKEDFKQQAWVFALEALPKYQSKDDDGNDRPLANFIYTHVFRRFLNLYRDKFHKPCPVELTSGVSPQDELRYEKWVEKNANMKKVLIPTALVEGIHTYNKSSENESELEVKEIESLIDEKLDVKYRSDYLQMKSGMTIPYAKRMAVTKEIKNIIKNIIIID